MVIELQYYEDITLDHINALYESQCEKERRAVIQTIAHSRDKSKSRLLIDIFPHIAWRDTQAALLQAIGETQEIRGVEFLIRYIRDSEDLALASQAILGLGYSQLSVAGEYLLSLLKENQGRLKQDALIGLAMMPHFGCDEELLAIIGNPDSSETLKLFAILCAGRRGLKAGVEAIVDIAQNDEGKLRNASILALGHLLSPEKVESIYNRHSPFRLFVDELMLYAGDRIAQRAHHSLEDSVMEVLANSELDWCTSFRLLREFPSDQVWAMINNVEENLDADKACLLRASTLSEDRAQEDLQFLKQSQHQLSSARASILLRQCLKSNEASDVLSHFNMDVACRLLSYVKVDNILDFSGRFYETGESSNTIEFINAIVNQSLMSTKVQPEILDFLLSKLKLTECQAIKQRLMRALAQLGCVNPNYIKEIKKYLTGNENVSNIFYCLSLLKPAVSAKILLERAERIFKSPQLALLKQKDLQSLQEEEIYLVIKSLSRIGKFDGAAGLNRLPKEFHATLSHYLIQILAHNEVGAFESLIETTLFGNCYCDNLIAINAVIYNSTDKLCDHLVQLLDAKDSAVRSKAIHALCVCGRSQHHADLLTWFKDKAFEEGVARKIFSTLTPREGCNYDEVIELIEGFLKKRKGPFVDDSIISEAIACLDVLFLLKQGKRIDGENEATHQQDATLQSEVDAYANYSQTIKVILRNAELTWQHSELFNQLVDKSTMLIQYSKSADLLLQQKLGYPLFHNPQEDLLAKLQNRILALNLDEKNSQAKVISNLGLEGYFTTRDFPVYKLQSLVKSVMSGKIMVDRFRAIDGLRAWSLVLLLFGRTFSAHGQKYRTILPVRFSAEHSINSIVKLMNKLQDLRNSAAHHGVLLEAEELAGIRSESFKLLNLLERSLA